MQGVVKKGVGGKCFVVQCSFEPMENGGYGVDFPDILGCVSMGDTYEKAEKNAKEALGYHLYEMEKDNEVLPQSSELKELEIEKDTALGYLIAVSLDVAKKQLDN